MGQTIGRCHVPLLKNTKTLVFGEYDKGYYGIGILSTFYLKLNYNFKSFK